MRIKNGLSHITLEHVSIVVNFTDEDGNPVEENNMKTRIQEGGNMMTRFMSIFCLIGIVSIVAFIGLPLHVAGEQKAQAIKEMIALVPEATLEAFLQATETNQWKAPVIYSQWHVEQIAAEDDRPVMLEARNFGKALAERLSEWRSLMTDDVSFDQLRLNIEGFLKLADWVMETRGYGNLFLAARCHDIATVGIGRLIVNLEYPLDIATGLLNALESSEYVPSVRQQILHQEAGVDLFVFASTQEADIKSSLEDTWNTGALFISVQEAPQLKAALEGNPPEGMEWLQSPTMQQILQRASPLLKEHIAFFKDDMLPDVVTTLSMWDKKWHYKIMIGFRPLNIYYLNALATFRDAVGFFPTKPTFSEEQLKLREVEIQTAQMAW